MKSYIVSFALALSGIAAAHSVWIETVEGKLVVRFGDVGEHYEKSPGHLDSLSTPKAHIAPVKLDDKPASIEVEKEAEFFLLKDTSPEKAAVISTIFPVMGKAATAKKPASARWPQFYARWQAPGTVSAPTSILDIVPSSEKGKATVYFKGKPLAGAELVLIQPNGKEVDLVADEAGTVTFTTAGKGLFVLAVAGYSETASGTYLGKEYTVISHNSSCAWQE